MRRLATLTLLAVTACACTPTEEAAWLRWHDLDPSAAVEYLYDHGIADRPDYPGEADEPDLGGQCSQWSATALVAGWPAEQWPTVDRIMWAESRCNPNAYNPASGVAGLMQIHPLWRADAECAVDLYDPVANLRCARHVYAVQGWQAWVTY